MRASPAPNGGLGASSYTSCSGPPSLWSRTAFMVAPSPTARPLGVFPLLHAFEKACGSLLVSQSRTGDWFGLRPDEAPHGCTLHPARRKKQRRPHALLVTELLAMGSKTNARVDRP